MKRSRRSPDAAAYSAVLFLLALAAGRSAIAQQIVVPPPPRGFGTSAAEVVVDSAHVLSQSAVDRINAMAYDVHAKSGGEIAVLTLPDLGGRSVEEMALQVGRQWGVGANTAIGSSTRNAGVVILVVPKETSQDGRGHVRIESGRGSEGFLTDARAGDIQREAIPYFQRQDYDGAVVLIARRVAERFASEFGFTLDSGAAPAPPEEAPPSGGGGFPPIIAMVVFLVLLSLLTNVAGRREGRQRGCSGCLTLMLLSSLGGRGRRGWGGGGGGGFGGGSFGGGGGFGGFGGGGGFSGGGSSGSW